MKHVLRVFIVMFALLMGGMAVAEEDVVLVVAGSETRCQKKPAPAGCKKPAKERSVEKQKIQKQQKTPPARSIPELSKSVVPVATTSTLSSKQSEMREAFMECIKLSTSESPTKDVVEFVFRAQSLRENTSIRSFFQALRGSPVHHAHEVCLVRSFGLKGFRDLKDIQDSTGTLLVGISSPFVDVVEGEIPPDRRFARSWVRDYVVALGEDMHQYFLNNAASGISFVPLRITSMIRSHEDQAKIVRRGQSPADCRYPFLCTTHSSGSGIDLGLKNVSMTQRAWLEQRLILDQRNRKIFFIRENSHYHVLVLPREYMGEE